MVGAFVSEVVRSSHFSKPTALDLDLVDRRIQASDGLLVLIDSLLNFVQLASVILHGSFGGNAFFFRSTKRSQGS